MTKTIPFAERRTLGLREAVAYAGLSRATLDRMWRAGSIRSIKVGGRRLIFRESLDALLHDGSKEAA